MYFPIVGITASDGTGSNGAAYPSDYEMKEMLITFVDNQQHQVFSWKITDDDNNFEGSEMFILTLSEITRSGDIILSTADITIKDYLGLLRFLQTF